MKAKPYSLLLHPAFLLSLLTLILNDWFFKYQFHNAITGKLSDFAGLFAVAVFFSVFFPNHKKTVILLTGLLFMWWKSSLSESFISFCNLQFHLPVHRVVDYTDYMAVLVLPFSFYLKPVYYSPSLLRQVAIGCICAISFTSFTATSMIRRATDDNRVQLDTYIRTKKNKEEIVAAIKKDGMDPQPIPAIYDKRWNYRYYVKKLNSDSSFTMIPVDSLYHGVYTKIDYGAIYNIPTVYVAGDTLKNLDFIITDINKKKNHLILHSFEYTPGSSYPNYSAYAEWRKYKKSLKKKFKTLVKK